MTPCKKKQGNTLSLPDRQFAENLLLLVSKKGQNSDKTEFLIKFTGTIVASILI